MEETTQARVSGTLNPIVGHGPFSVLVRLRGQSCGEYRHGTRKQAEVHAKAGRDKLGVLGFTYRVMPNAAGQGRREVAWPFLMHWRNIARTTLRC